MLAARHTTLDSFAFRECLLSSGFGVNSPVTDRQAATVGLAFQWIVGCAKWDFVENY